MTITFKVENDRQFDEVLHELVIYAQHKVSKLGPVAQVSWKKVLLQLELAQRASFRNE